MDNLNYINFPLKIKKICLLYERKTGLKIQYKEIDNFSEDNNIVGKLSFNEQQKHQAIISIKKNLNINKQSTINMIF